VASDQLSVVSLLKLILVTFVFGSTDGAQNVGNWQCADELVQPNLVLEAKTHIYGELKDPSGAALERSKVILRKQTKTGRLVAYRITTTDQEGKFDFKAIETGNFRFCQDLTEDGNSRRISRVGDRRSARSSSQLRSIRQICHLLNARFNE